MSRVLLSKTCIVCNADIRSDHTLVKVVEQPVVPDTKSCPQTDPLEDGDCSSDRSRSDDQRTESSVESDYSEQKKNQEIEPTGNKVDPEAESKVVLDSDNKLVPDPALADQNIGHEAEDSVASSSNKKLMAKKKSHLLRYLDSEGIQCAKCLHYFHLGCTHLEQFEYKLYEEFHCRPCSLIHGPSIEWPKVAKHRLNWADHEQARLKIEIGSEKWIDDFINQEHEHPAPPSDVMIRVKDRVEFLEKFNENGGAQNWSKVYFIDNAEGLGMTLPDPDTFNIDRIMEIMGPEYKVDVIEVHAQKTYEMTLRTFAQKMSVAPEHRQHIYNFLSLEFSDNDEMKKMLVPPKLVRELSMVDQLWPSADTEAYKTLMSSGEVIPEEQRPRVEQFILCGMAKSYTDFHIDFGGSSVFYHIIKGEKIFYLIAPTDKNLKAFKEYSTKTRREWFDKKVAEGEVKRVVIREGNTVLIPSGWIHAVYTPCDSLVFGGNYLHAGNVAMQFRIFHLENHIRNKNRTDQKFYFPSFLYTNWMFVRNIMLPELRQATEEGESLLKTDFLSNMERFVKELKKWLGDDDTDINYGASDEREKILADVEKYVQKQKKNKKNRDSSPKRPAVRRTASNASRKGSKKVKHNDE